MEIERLNRMFSDFYNESFGRGLMPPVDIYENENHEVVLKAELPDIKREAVRVTFENNVLTLSGERTLDSEIKRERFQRLERQYGSFCRSITLPATVDASRIRASYKDGVLTVRIPQREEAKPKQIAISTE
jgi:HSP20 family protein